MAIELLEIKTDIDGNGITILRRQYANINGVTYYSAPERQAFRSATVNETGQTVINDNFSTELDLFTGIDNFLTSFYNFNE